jgi:hypothetical protein
MTFSSVSSTFFMEPSKSDRWCQEVAMTGHSLQDKLYAQDGERSETLVAWDKWFSQKIKATGRRFDDLGPVYSSNLKKKNLKTKKM